RCSIRRGRPGNEEGSMDYGLFTMPSHPPERGLFDGHQWDLRTLRWAGELGFSGAWIGEHHTAPWEPHPAPDLLVAQSLLQTTRMRIGPGGFLMPYHHPAELANRVAMLDHLAQGRLNFGVAASGLPSDWAMFNVDGISGQHRGMTRRPLAFISHPPTAPGGRGYWPMSLNLTPPYLGSHWESVEMGAAKSGRTPKRSDWRLVREIFIADTDAEAMKLSAGGMMGRMMKEYFLPLLSS